MELNELLIKVHQNAKSKGFWDDENPNIPERLALIHSEVSEALEALRKSHFADVEQHSMNLSQGEQFDSSFRVAIKSSFEDELADVIIRVLDLCGYMNIDIGLHVNLKMQYNSNREYKHGKNF
jgi:NTP pyrophosphatase (non-canonical NTP hydrolase)